MLRKFVKLTAGSGDLSSVADGTITSVEAVNATSIRNYAFSGCTALKSINMPNITTIGKQAFDSCNSLVITSLPSTLTTIGDVAFGSCKSLTTITFEGTPTTIAADTFYNCSNLATINVPWSEGEMANAPWGATNATINYGGLYIPVLSISGDTLTITEKSGRATSFDILVGGEVVGTTSSNTFDLSALGLAEGVYNISAIAKASGYNDSAESVAIAYVYVKNCIVFSSPSSFTLNVVDNTKYWDGTLEYSTDANTWDEWNGTTAISADNGVLCMRGTGNTYITGSSAFPPKAYWELTGSKISCVGNIENLLDYTTVANGEHPVMADHCYQFMFMNCTSLITAPELPATTLADSCYYDMFRGCTKLTTAPELPATTLADYCYGYMFSGCTGLITAPKLPATTLADYCYQSMFMNCTRLTTAPELPATPLASGCYDAMFFGCRRLTTAPELPATTLAPYCYERMFYACTSLKLSTEQTDEYTTIYRIPTSGTGTTATDALANMFASTGGTFTGTPEINTTYYLHSSNSVV